MAKFFVRNLTLPVESVAPFGTLVDAPSTTADSAAAAYAALKGVQPGDVLSIIAVDVVQYRQVTSQLVYPAAPAAVVPPLPANGQ